MLLLKPCWGDGEPSHISQECHALAEHIVHHFHPSIAHALIPPTCFIFGNLQFAVEGPTDLGASTAKMINGIVQKKRCTVSFLEMLNQVS